LDVRARTEHLTSCSNLQAQEWEEKWGEQYWSMGRAKKYANKWGKEGINVWHERWGEDYDGEGGCFKYTDKASDSLSSQSVETCLLSCAHRIVFKGNL
jgi:hypothetical protein